jgi:hypothetical protein
MHSESKFPLACLAAVSFLGLSCPVLTAAQEAAAEAVPAEDHSAGFKTLDADFARIDGLFVKYTDPIHKLTILGYISLLKVRAKALGWEGTVPPQGGRGGPGGEPPEVEWDSVKYDELRYDINLQGQRLANWLAPLRTPPPAVQSERRAGLAVHRLNPAPDNAAEVKAALDVLDREIRQMENRTSTMIIGSAARDAEVARIARIKDRRTALGKEFTKARWDALVGDLKP